MKEITHKWIKEAEEDYNFAAMSLQFEKFYSRLCFLFQQAAEKYLKAYILENDLQFEKVHDLIKLLNTCKKKDENFNKLEEACKNLNQYYTETRYPDDILETYYEKIDAEKSKESCEEIRNFIKKEIT